MVEGILYSAIHLQPLAVQVIWLKKIKCENSSPTQFGELNSGFTIITRGHVHVIHRPSSQGWAPRHPTHFWIACLYTYRFVVFILGLGFLLHSLHNY